MSSLSNAALALNQDDVALLKQLVDMARKTQGASGYVPQGNTLNRPERGIPDLPGPQVYIALTPLKGIPAMLLHAAKGRPLDTGSGTGSDIGAANIPGYALCDVYRVDATHDVLAGFELGTGSWTQQMQPVPGNQQLVFNFSQTALPGEEWFLVSREKYGVWVAIPNYGACPDINSFHQKGNSRGYDAWYPATGNIALAKVLNSTIPGTGSFGSDYPGTGHLEPPPPFMPDTIQTSYIMSGESGALGGLAMLLDRPAGTGCFGRLAIYDCPNAPNGDLYPGKLIVDTEDFDMSDWDNYTNSIEFIIPQAEQLMFRRRSLYWAAMMYRLSDQTPPSALTSMLLTGGKLTLNMYYAYVVTAVIGNTETIASHLTYQLTNDPLPGEGGTSDPDTGTGSDKDALQKIVLNWTAPTSIYGSVVKYRIYRYVSDTLEGVIAADSRKEVFRFLDETTAITYTDDGSHDPPQIVAPFTLNNHESLPLAAPFVVTTDPKIPILGRTLPNEAGSVALFGWLANRPWALGFPAQFPQDAVANGDLTIAALFYRFRGGQ